MGHTIPHKATVREAQLHSDDDGWPVLTVCCTFISVRTNLSLSP